MKHRKAGSGLHAWGLPVVSDNKLAKYCKVSGPFEVLVLICGGCEDPLLYLLSLCMPAKSNWPLLGSTALFFEYQL